jgi:hypothetical protein
MNVQDSHRRASSAEGSVNFVRVESMPIVTKMGSDIIINYNDKM